MSKADKVEFLRELAEKLLHIPVCYGTDDGDIDTLLIIARELEEN